MWRLVRAAVVGLLIGTLVATLLPDLGEAASFAARIACILAALMPSTVSLRLGASEVRETAAPKRRPHANRLRDYWAYKVRRPV